MTQAPSSFSLVKAEKFLDHQGQLALFEYIKACPSNIQVHFLKQLSELSTYLPNDYSPTNNFKSPDLKSLTPLTSVHEESLKDTTLGDQAFKKSQVLSIVLAGGDGSRLGFSEPKGCFEISPITKKSLFELHCEKILALQNQLSIEIPLVILTSNNNHTATVAYFEKHHFFGLAPVQVTFIKQPQFPLYDENHKWFLKTPTEICTGPCGNGALFQSVKPYLDPLSHIAYILVTNIDNALANPCDPTLVGSLINHQAELSLRCFKRAISPHKVGVLAYLNTTLSIIDYTDLPNNDSFPYGNINTFCFSSSFFKTVCDTNSLPIHWVKKPGTFYDPKTKTSKQISVWKGEYFITDSISLAKKVAPLNSAIQVHFAPLKQLEGIDGVHAVQKALLEKELFFR